MRSRIFCQQSCRHTEPWEPCPNQIPAWVLTGKGGPTEEAVGLQQDESAHFLRAITDIPASTFITAFGEAVIIRQSSRTGKEFVDCYSTIQETQGGMKCQYTYRETTGSDTCWICPQPDINIISANVSKDLKKALTFRSKLKGAGHAAQHSCCKQRSKSENRYTHRTQGMTRYPRYGRRHLAVSATVANAQGRAVHRHH